MADTFGRYLVIVMTLVLLASGCRNDELSTDIRTDFECGAIGDVLKISDAEWQISLADDNLNDTLPDTWRNWWYIQMNRIPVDTPVVIHLKNRGWPYYYLPVYSYDRKNWHRFLEAEVTQPESYELRMEKQFTESTVWIARFYPYTYSDLMDYLQSIVENPDVTVDIPALTQEGNPIYLLTITDKATPDSGKKRIWIHARTHPAETGPSFVLEGLIAFLLSGLPEAQSILSQFIFHCVPMQNVDGVVAGNYRTTPRSENLEVMWYPDPDDPMRLTGEAPVEVTALRDTIAALVDQGPPFTIALNLHASNSEPAIRPFFYPHFGSETQGYTKAEASLWNKQLRFMASMAYHYGETMLEPAPGEGGASFASKTYPESWWWQNFQDQVMAITMETTYGTAGYEPDWITPEDLRSLGDALAPALRDYADAGIVFTSAPDASGIESRKRRLMFPEAYPPDALDEMKQ